MVWEPRESLGLCPSCRARLRRWPEDACIGCGRPAATEVPEGWHCAACRDRPPPYDRLLATWCYLPPVDQVLLALKFRRLDYLGPQVGRAMAAAHRDVLAGCDAVTAVPLHWTRRLGRGYDQAALIARGLAAELGLPFVRPIVRRRPTSPQSRLEREARKKNLAGAFAPRRGASCEGLRMLLVDDVTTTGATLAAAASALRRAGALEITVLAAARTPRAGEV